jgi:hypothetical protein
MAPKIYLETTMFSFYYETRTEARYQELKVQTRQTFELIKVGKYEPYSSDYAMQELSRTTSQEKRENMLKLIAEYHITLLPDSDEADRLAALGPLNGSGGLTCERGTTPLEYTIRRRYWKYENH